MELLLSATHRIGAVPKTTVIVILGAYLAGGITRHALIGAGLASLVWLYLYGMNERWDERLESPEKLHHEDDPALEVIYLLLGITGLASWLKLGDNPTAILLAMAWSEIMYSHPMIRMKKYPWAGPILSGIIGPTLRFGLGVYLSHSATTNWTLVGCSYAMLLVLHLPGAIKSRVYRRVRDKGLGYYTLSCRFVQRMQPMQFLTPVGVIALGLILAYAEQLKFFPPGTMMAGLILAVFLVTATWKMNDIHDYGGLDDIERAVAIMHDMWKLKFRTKRLRVTFGFAVLLGFLFAISCPTALIAVATGVYLALDRAVGYHY